MPRSWAGAVAAVVLGCAVVVPQRPVAAADICGIEEWQIDPQGCVGRLGDVVGQRLACLKAPTPDGPDTGVGGWFARHYPAADGSGVHGYYTDWGYAGYAYTTYDVGCAATLMHPDYKFENTIANVEFMMAVVVIGAADALREWAWDPDLTWSWADALVEQATRSIYQRVFTVFGVVTLVVVGVYLLWRSRQARMSAALTTAGWAVLVMVIITALARWPVQSARVADRALITSLAAIHDAVGPPPRNLEPGEVCSLRPEACVDHRPPALRASDNAVATMLYRNWMRGLLGCADCPTADKYGFPLYLARTLDWLEIVDVREDPKIRDLVFERKADQWMRVAEQIKSEDPEAYQYLQGTRGMERIGAGFIALLSAVLFAIFDVTASALVLLGFLVFRWAVIAAPMLGTVALLHPASAGLRRLGHAVVAALFNVVVFGTGAAVYLHAVDIIMNTAALPGWLQVVLVLLCGVVGWLLLRPYRRITQLGGKDPLAAIASGGLVRRPAAVPAPAVAVERQPSRAELSGDPSPSISRTVREMLPASALPSPPPTSTSPQRDPARSGWQEPTAEVEPGYALYRPAVRSSSTVEQPVAPSGVRVEARPDPS